MQCDVGPVSPTAHLVVVLSAPHNCNKTKIKELYKTCRTLAADQALLVVPTHPPLRHYLLATTETLQNSYIGKL